MESCRFVARRSLGRRLGSVLDVGNRLHRMRGGFHRCIHISKVLCARLLWTMVVSDGEPVATGQVLGVAPPVNAVVGAKGASAPPAPSGFCTQCGAPMASDARFCGSCGAAR